MRIWIAVCVTCFGALRVRAEESFAVLRSGAKVQLSGLSPAGACLAAEQGRPVKCLSLSQLKSVEGPLSQDFRPLADLSQRLWRAQSRLKRQDAQGAEPLLEALWKETQGWTGPTRAEIAAGWLACRNAHDPSASAVAPWVEWLDHSDSLDAENAAKVRDSIPNLASGDIWITNLPPIWLDSPSVRQLAETGLGASSKRTGHPSGADLLQIYVAAARRDSGMSSDLDPAKLLHDPGWANIAGELVLSESTDATVRSEARSRLIGRISSTTPAWMLAWCRLGLGRSLLMEDDAEQRRLGTLSLLWVASRPDADPWLASLALGDAARGLAALGDWQGCRAVLADLEQRYAESPVLESIGFATVRRQAAQHAPVPPISVSGPTPAPAAAENDK
ncbi:MAG: hypothetical protein U0573_11140 [Phycisphaerales bacterium]|nr:hypothetical protein [Planctomycetota bacterium]